MVEIRLETPKNSTHHVCDLVSVVDVRCKISNTLLQQRKKILSSGRDLNHGVNLSI